MLSIDLFQTLALFGALFFFGCACAVLFFLIAMEIFTRRAARNLGVVHRDSFVAQAVRRALLDLQGGDELQRLARQLGLRDPWVSRLGPTDFGEHRQTGRTNRMILMAILSLRRGVPVIVVGVDHVNAKDIGLRLATYLSALGWLDTGGTDASGRLRAIAEDGRRVELRWVGAISLVQATLGREHFDLYIDHAVHEYSPLAIDVTMTNRGPVVYVAEPGPRAAAQSRPRTQRRWPPADGLPIF